MKKRRKHLTIGRYPDGKPIIKNFYGKSKKNAMKNKCYKLEVAISRKQEWDTTLFSEWTDTWLNIYKENVISESTYYMYKLCVDHINQYFDGYNICLIRTVYIQKFSS